VAGAGYGAARDGRPRKVLQERLMFAAIRDILFVVAVYAYFTGWVYAYGLYSHFGLSLNAVEIPVYHFFMYSYFMLPDGSWTTTILVTTAGLVLVVAGPTLQRWVTSRPRVAWLGAVLLIVALPGLFWAARQQALGAAIRMRSGGANTIHFSFKKDAETRVPAAVRQRNEAGGLRMVTETKDRYYVFFQPQGEAEELPYAHVYSVAKDDVVLTDVDVRSALRRP
jgi:hypothetical protein